MTFKEKLVILRKKAGMTQGDLAEALLVSRQSIHKWESGQCYPEVPKLIAMKAIFEISIDDLLDDSVDVEMPEKKRSRRVKKEAPADEMAAPVSKISEISTEENNEVKEYIAQEIKEEPKEEVKEEVSEPEVEHIDVQVIEEERKEKTETKEADSEKKKGFFSKLFGRK